jgi:hypothetical protein
LLEPFDSVVQRKRSNLLKQKVKVVSNVTVNLHPLFFLITPEGGEVYTVCTKALLKSLGILLYINIWREDTGRLVKPIFSHRLLYVSNYVMIELVLGNRIRVDECYFRYSPAYLRCVHTVNRIEVVSMPVKGVTNMDETVKVALKLICS